MRSDGTKIESTSITVLFSHLGFLVSFSASISWLDICFYINHKFYGFFLVHNRLILKPFLDFDETQNKFLHDRCTNHHLHLSRENKYPYKMCTNFIVHLCDSLSMKWNSRKLISIPWIHIDMLTSTHQNVQKCHVKTLEKLFVI